MDRSSLAVSQLPEPLRLAYEPSQVGSDLAAIEAFPGRLAALLANVDDRSLGSTYRPGGWTVAQIVHHLVDSHLHSYARCKFALCESNPSIKPYDENLWVATPECTPEEVGVALTLLAALHARWVRMLRGLDEAGWSRTFHHPERHLDFALYQQAGLYAWHGEHHLAQAALALGRQLPV